MLWAWPPPVVPVSVSWLVRPSLAALDIQLPPSWFNWVNFVRPLRFRTSCQARSFPACWWAGISATVRVCFSSPPLPPSVAKVPVSLPTGKRPRRSGTWKLWPYPPYVVPMALYKSR